MDNHAHLVLAEGKRPLSRVMQRINGWYAMYYNRRYAKRGAVFDGRYKPIVVDGDAYLLGLIRYVHLNPVKAGLVALEGLGAHPWTGHGALLGELPARLVVADDVLGLFGVTVGAARLALMEWMRAGLAPDADTALRARVERGSSKRQEGEVDPRVLGDAGFVGRVLSSASATEETERGWARRRAEGWTGARVRALACELLGADEARLVSGGHGVALGRARSLTAALAAAHLGLRPIDLGRLLGVTAHAAADARARGEELLSRLQLDGLEGLQVATQARTSEGPLPPRKEDGDEPPPSLAAVVDAVATVTGIEAAVLLGPSRRRSLSEARRALAAVAVHRCGHSRGAIARAAGRSGPAVAGWVDAGAPAALVDAVVDALGRSPSGSA